MPQKVNLFQFKEYGEVTEIRQDVVHVKGLTNCMNGQLVNIADNARGVIVGFDTAYVLVLLVSQTGAIKPGDRVMTTLDDFRIPTGTEFLGRMVNALGEPLDRKGRIQSDTTYPIFNSAPSVLERIPLTEVLETGTKIIDMLKPVGRGQRMLLIGDRMTGKTTVAVDAVLNQKGKDVICIYCCIGKSEAAVNKIVELFDQNGVWEYGVIVVAAASDPMGQQYLAPYVAASIGEYFMHDKDMDVFVVFDDFTKHAWAYRQISLLLERAPGRDAYPGDIFYIHSQLVERAGKMRPERGGGSMTHMPIVETLQGDVAGYIPSNIVSMTDGQIYMSTPLFGEGFKPAIDMGLSVSRIGSRVQWPAMKKLTAMLQLEFVRYKELEKLTRIRAGASADVEERLKKGKVLEELLKQDQNVPVPMHEQVLLLFILQEGFLEHVEPDEVKGLLRRTLGALEKDSPELVEELIRGRELTDDIRKGLHEHLTRLQNPAV